MAVFLLISPVSSVIILAFLLAEDTLNNWGNKPIKFSSQVVFQFISYCVLQELENVEQDLNQAANLHTKG